MLRSLSRLRIFAFALTALLVLVACGDEGDDTAAGDDVDGEEWEPPDTVEVVVHSGPGGGTDVFARAITQLMHEEGLTANPWPVTNVEGGSGAAAMAHMTQEQGNDETIASITMTWIATSITTEGAVDITNLTPIAQVLIEPTFIAARADAPFDDFDEMIEWSEDNPGQLNVSGGSVTSHASIVASAIQEETGTEWRFISFPGGGERVAAMLSGDTDIMFGSLQDFEQHVRADNLKWIASIEAERSDFLDEVPTIQELGYDVPVLEQVRGFVGPPGMTPEIVAGYERVIQDFTETEAWEEYVTENGWTNAFAASEEWGQTLEELSERLEALLADVDLEEDA